MECLDLQFRDLESLLGIPALTSRIFVQWGPLLLQIIAHWSPKQINLLSGGKLKPNLITKRVKAARLQASKLQEQVKSPEKRNGNPRKRKRDKDSASRICEDGPNTEHLVVESEASRQFRISQMEIEEAVKTRDPNYEMRQIGRSKKMPGLDRILIEQAFEERERNLNHCKSTLKGEDVPVDLITLNLLTPILRRKQADIELVYLD